MFLGTFLVVVSGGLLVFGNTAAAEIHPLEPALARPDTSGKILWYDVRLLGVEGKGWSDTEDYYDRLPARAKDMVREPVWNLSKNSAGLCVRFLTDAAEIHAAWDGGHGLPHMAATGASGVDLYVKQNGKWTFRRVGKPDPEWTERRHDRRGRGGHSGPPPPNRPGVLAHGESLQAGAERAAWTVKSQFE